MPKFMLLGAHDSLDATHGHSRHYRHPGMSGSPKSGHWPLSASRVLLRSQTKVRQLEILRD